MKVWYINRDGGARKREFADRHAFYQVFNGSVHDEQLVVHRWRKTGRWGVYRIGQLHAGRVFPKPLFQDKNRQTVMAWAQMFAAMTKGENA